MLHYHQISRSLGLSASGAFTSSRVSATWLKPPRHFCTNKQNSIEFQWFGTDIGDMMGYFLGIWSKNIKNTNKKWWWHLWHLLPAMRRGFGVDDHGFFRGAPFVSHERCDAPGWCGASACRLDGVGPKKRGGMRKKMGWLMLVNIG